MKETIQGIISLAVMVGAAVLFVTTIVFVILLPFVMASKLLDWIF